MFDNNCMLCVGQQLAYCMYLVALFHCLVFCRQCVFMNKQINDDILCEDD